MDVNSIMNTYNMSSLWNNLNSNNNTSSTVPLVNNVDSSVQESYNSMNYFGQNTNTELQSIFQQVEPTYGIPLTYTNSGNLIMPTNTSLPTDGISPSESNIVSLLQSNNSTEANSEENLLSQYTSIENGTFQPNLSSILSSNLYGMYSNVSSLTNNAIQYTGNFLNNFA
jgi:hypothetical protein